MTVWMLWSVGVACLVGAAATFGERVLRATGRPGRGAWIAALGVLGLLYLWTLAPEPSSSITLPAVPAGVGGGSAVSTPGAMALVEAWVSGWDRYATVLWLAASGGLALLLVLGLGRLQRAVSRCAEARIADTEVRVSSDYGPALVGFVRPTIVVPRWLRSLEHREQRLAVLHEREHRDAGDNWLLLAGSLAIVAAPWNPALWWIGSRLRQSIEVDCDQRVLDSGAQTGEYGRLLIDLSVAGPNPPLPVATLAHRTTLLERRLRMMTKGSANESRGRTLASGVVATALLVAACGAPAPSGLTAGDEDGVTVTLTDPAAIESGQATAIDFEAAAPLIYVDGVRIEGGMPEQLSPDLIESVEVLKGEAAFEQYGEEASNGVILITMKEVPSELRIRVEGEGDAAVTTGALRLRASGPKVPPEDLGGVTFRARELAPGESGSLEGVRIFVDGVETESIVDLDPETIDRMEVVKQGDERRINVFLKR